MTVDFPTGQGQAVFAYLPDSELATLPGGGGGSICPCGITDDFERIEPSVWGISNSTLPWVVTVLSAGSTISVDGGGGVLHGAALNTQVIVMTLGSPTYHAPFDETAIRTMRFQLPNYDTNWDMTFQWRPSNSYIFGPALFIRESASWLTYVLGAGTVIPAGFWNSTTTYTWTHYRVGGTTTRMTISDGVQSFDADFGGDPTLAQCSVSVSVEAGSTPPTIRILDIDIPEITPCSVARFDEFGRDITLVVQNEGGWGANDYGLVWNTLGPGTISPWVEGGFGKLRGGQVEENPDILGVVLIDYGTGQSGMSTGSSSVTSYPWSGDFSMSVRFKYEVLPDPDTYFHQGGFVVRKFGSPDVAGVGWTHDSPDSPFTLFEQGGTSATIEFPWTQGVFYICDMQREGLTLRARIYLEDSTPPGWMSIALTSLWAGTLFESLVTSPNWASTFFPPPISETWYDYIRFEGITPCMEIGLVPSEDNPATQAPVVYGQGTVSG